MPPLPVRVHIASDVSAKDAHAFRVGMSRWSAAHGQTVYVETDSPDGCGVRVVRGELEVRGEHMGDNDLGLTTPVEQCRLVMRLSGGLDQAAAIKSASHELGHGLRLDSHSTDPHSVMSAGQIRNAVITAADIERTRVEMPQRMQSAPMSPETWPYRPQVEEAEAL